MKLFLLATIAAVARGSATRDNRQLLKVPVPICSGALVRQVIDFEKDRKGRETLVGDTPELLPHGVKVKGSRPDNDSPTSNDLAFFDTANPSVGNTDLASDTEGKVIVISENKDDGYEDGLSANEQGTSKQAGVDLQRRGRAF